MDDSDDEIFWGPVTKHEFQVVRSVFLDGHSKMKNTAGVNSGEEYHECEANDTCSDRSTYSKSEKENISATEQEEFHSLQEENDYCKIINMKSSLQMSEYQPSVFSTSDSKSDVGIENGEKLIEDSDTEIVEINDSDNSVGVSLEILSSNSQRKSKICIPRIIVTSPRNLLETCDSIQESVGCHPSIVNCEVSETGLQGTASVSAADSIVNKNFGNTEVAASLLSEQCSTISTNSECVLKTAESLIYLDSLCQISQSNSGTNVDNDDKGRDTSFSHTCDTSINCLPSMTLEERNLKADQTVSISYSPKSSLGLKSEVSSSDIVIHESDQVRKIHSSFSDLDGNICDKENDLYTPHCNESVGTSTYSLSNMSNEEMGLKKDQILKSSLSSNKSNIHSSDIVIVEREISKISIGKECGDKDLTCSSIMCSSNSSCVPNSVESIPQSMSSSGIQPESVASNDACVMLHCEKSKLSKKDPRYSNYVKEKFSLLKRNALPEEMLEDVGEVSDSMLWSSDSDDGNESDSLNNTFEEIDLMMKHGLEYICSKNDSSNSHQSAQASKQQKIIPPTVQLTSCKRIPFGSKHTPHCIPNQKVISESNMKKNISPRIGADHVFNPCIKAPRNVAGRDLKICPKKANFLSNIKSPIAEYISHRPVPLVAVKNINAKSNARVDNTPLRNLQSHCNISPVQPTPFRNVQIQHTSGKNVIPLPVIKYETAPVVNVMQPRSAENNVPSKMLAVTPKVTKHTGRALLASASSDARQLMKQTELSMVYIKDVSPTSTL